MMGEMKSCEIAFASFIVAIPGALSILVIDGMQALQRDDEVSERTYFFRKYAHIVDHKPLYMIIVCAPRSFLSDSFLLVRLWPIDFEGIENFCWLHQVSQVSGSVCSTTQGIDVESGSL